MLARNPARYLAPIALVAAIAGTYMIVHKGLSQHPTRHTHAVVHLTRTQRRYEKAKFYVVQAGDSLSRISTQTGIDVPTLEALNPNLDPNALQTSQRLRLRR
jgi:LysM repeat protein